ncbi:MAG: S-layer homology domain-containing protein, partial [Clostridia bacterium]|nr:S-layer homology domain-containing protein [Clostridia bacterium]
KVLLLGDSEASGFTDYGDEMSEFTRVDDSYAAYVADELGAELIPMACPGFRTLELRVMLDDNYRPEDKYLFKKVPRTPEDEIMAKAPAMKQAIKDSDIIMIGIGGNDWGAYLGWTMEDIQLENKLPEEFKIALRELLENATVEDDLIAQIIDLADYLNAQDEVLAALPEAMKYAFSNLRTNWEYIVEYIYENNPDVTLVVVGMFPTYYQTPEGEPENVAQPNAAKKMVEDAIINYGNKHMVDNIGKYGYIYVEPTDVIVEDSHPTLAGHRTITECILNALPDARFQYSGDVSIRDSYYKEVEYVTINGIMQGTSAVTFSPEEALTKADFTMALNNITGNCEISDSTAAVNKLGVAAEIFKCAEKNSITSFFAALKLSLEIFTTGDLKITRADGAEILYKVAKTF